MAKTTDSPGKDPSGDPSLPHKKRARRRLVGAAAIGLAAAIVLPMILDSEPKREPSDVKVQIPSRDTPLKGASPGAGAFPPSTTAGSQASGTITIPSPPSAGAAPASAPSPGASSSDKAGSGKSGADTKVSDAAAKAAEQKAAEAKQAEAKQAEAKQAEAKKAEAKQAEAKKAAEARKAAQSKAAEAKAGDSKSGDGKTADGKGGDSKAAGGKQFLLQAGAFSSEKSASDQAARVKQAGLRAYTEKVKTADGERVRVRVGPFPNREAAEQARGQLKLSGIDSAVIVP